MNGKHILLTGANGYIGRRLLPPLIQLGYKVTCAVREPARFDLDEDLLDRVEVIMADFLNPTTLTIIPRDIDYAYYLIHSMSHHQDFMEKEASCAKNFVEAMALTSVSQVVFLSGIVNESKLSEHLKSRWSVEQILSDGAYSLTTLRAGIIIGSGSASFEIIRDLVEKLPFMIAPKWLKTRCQPIGIFDVIQFLTKVLDDDRVMCQSYDIAGPDVLTYKEMLIGYAKARNLKRWIYTVPVMTPRLSSYWLYFITSTSYTLAVSLVDSMKVEVVAKDQKLADLLGVKPLNFQTALDRTLSVIDKDQVISSWKDSLVSSQFRINLKEVVKVPTNGCFIDQRSMPITSTEATLSRIWSIGGETGWYSANFLWKFRGYLDKLIGGVGLRRGRTHLYKIAVGDALDFWRVLYAERNEGRLLLFAEMKLPGEAWLEFKVKGNELIQTATFRPKGVLGRLYWYAVLPFHGIVFRGMIRRLAGG